MIDTFSLALTHGLMILAAWLLLRRPDLDREDSTPSRFGRRPRSGRDGNGNRPGA
jgi:hypothetical protein